MGSIAAVVDHEAAETEVDIKRVILFAWVPTTGWFRYRDRFQLVPVPPEAPRPQQLLADFPFIAEFPVLRSHVVGVRVARETTAEQEIRLLLGGLLRFGVTGQKWFHTSAWVSLGIRDGQPVPLNDGVVFATLYYGFDTFEASATSFSETAVLPPMPVEPDDIHYRRRGLTFEEVMSVPESFPALLDTYFALNDHDRASFRHACYWLVYAQEARRLSASAAFTSLVQAIEALLPDTRRQPRSGGGRPPTGPGPTRLFKNFVKKYVPDIDGQVRNRLYNVRSELVHGGRLVRSDYSPTGLHGWTPEDTHDWQIFDLARTAAQRGVVAWLQDHS